MEGDLNRLQMILQEKDSHLQVEFNFLCSVLRNEGVHDDSTVLILYH